MRYDFKVESLNEGTDDSGKGSVCGTGLQFHKIGLSLFRKLQVLRTISRYSYLWNRIRVQGGAYGAFSGFERNGNMFMVSYRDPNLKETLKVYDEMHSYMKDFRIEEREMTKYIIGTISKLDLPLTPFMKGERAIENYMRKITQEDLQKGEGGDSQHKEQDIGNCPILIFELMKRQSYCVLGVKQK